MDRFEQLQFIGQGMSSQVFKAFDRVTKSWVALKKINPHLSRDQISVERFKREIQITREIQHPGIITIHDLLFEQDQIVLVMEYLQGGSLHEQLQKKGAFSLENSLEVVTQLARILEACHNRGIAHRDLKPHNIFTLPSGEVKLIDFGIAKMASMTDLTQTGTSLGSPEYMAPELFGAPKFDARTDLYALGVVLFELLKGHPPFQGESLAVLYRQHLVEPVAAIQGIPAWVNKLVQKLLAKNPFERYQSATELLFDLTNKKVVTGEAQRLERIVCVSCAQKRLKDTPFCTSCGYAEMPTTANSTYSVWATDATQVKKLEKFLKGYFGIKSKIKIPRQGLRLLRRLPIEQAEVIQKAATEQGVYLQKRSDKIKDLVKQHAGLTFTGVLLGIYIANSFFSFAEDRMKNVTHDFWAEWRMEPPLLVNIFEHELTLVPMYIFRILLFPFTVGVEETYGLLFSAIFYSVVTLWGMRAYKTFRRPLLEELVLIKDSNASKFRLRELLPNFMSSRPVEIKNFDEQILEQFLIIQKTQDLSEVDQNHLFNVLKNSLELSAVASKMSQRRETELKRITSGGTEHAALLIQIEEVESRINDRLIIINSKFQSMAMLSSQKTTSATQVINELNGNVEKFKADLKIMVEVTNELKATA